MVWQQISFLRTLPEKGGTVRRIRPPQSLNKEFIIADVRPERLIGSFN